jgi:hypothetical protein
MRREAPSCNSPDRQVGVIRSVPGNNSDLKSLSRNRWGQALDSAILNPRCLLLKAKLDWILRANDVTARIA